MNPAAIYYSMMRAQSAAASSGPHRYYRLNITANQGRVSYCELIELQLRTALGGRSVAVGGTASANAPPWGASYPASNAFDANLSTTWVAGNTAEPWILTYDFGAGVTNSIVQYALYQNNGTDAASAWTLEYSDDGSTWTVADTVTGHTVGTLSWFVFNVANP